jgi:hypothetical protein
MMDAPVALGTDHNLPYVFDSFAYRGRIEGDLNTPVLLKNPEPREDELPLERSVVDFGSPEGTRKPLSSPCAECVEGEFSEVRGYKLPRPAPALYQSGRGRATFSPLPRP